MTLFLRIDFKDVLIMDPITVNKLSDTMLYAKKLSFEFSVWDITSGNYSVKQIHVKDAEINLYIDEEGNENYHFWKDSKEKSDEKFEFNLENVIIENTQINYVNQHNQQNYSFFTSETKLSGDFKEKTFDLNTNANLFVNHFYSGKIALLKKKQCHRTETKSPSGNSLTLSLSLGNISLSLLSLFPLFLDDLFSLTYSLFLT